MQEGKVEPSVPVPLLTGAMAFRVKQAGSGIRSTRPIRSKAFGALAYRFMVKAAVECRARVWRVLTLAPACSAQVIAVCLKAWKVGKPPLGVLIRKKIGFLVAALSKPCLPGFE